MEPFTTDYSTDTDTGSCCCSSAEVTTYEDPYATTVVAPAAPLVPQTDWEPQQQPWVDPTPVSPAPAAPVFEPAPLETPVARQYVDYTPVADTAAVNTPVASPVVDDASTAALYPQSMTIGGNDPVDFTIHNPDGSPANPYPTSMAIGGTDPLGYTIQNPDGTPYTAPTSMIIGGPTSGSTPSALAQVYGVAARNGDVMSQILINNIIQSQHNSIATWLLPNPVTVYRPW